jgi:hypothetical protein
VKSSRRTIGLSTRRLACLLATALVLLSATVGAAAALGAESVEGGGAFSELNQRAQESSTETTTTATTATVASTSEPKTNDGTLLIILGVAVVLLSGIGFVIVRDARRVAPATDANMLERNVSADRAIRQKKRREKAKAARKQRKRTR